MHIVSDQGGFTSLAEEFISQLEHYCRNKALGVILSSVLKNTLVEKLFAGLDSSLVSARQVLTFTGIISVSRIPST